MIVEVDPNEPKEIFSMIKDITDLLYIGSEIKVEIVSKKLPFGDWRIVDNDNRELKPLITERKSIYDDPDTHSYSNDMIASRNDGRWDSQREGMAQSDESVLYGVTGTFERMTRSERRSVGTYLASLWRLGIMASWFPNDWDLIHESFKLFEMVPDFIPSHKIKSDYDSNIELCARVFYQKEGISKSTALEMGKMVRISARINDLTPWDISHLVRKALGKEDKPVLLDVAVGFFCEWRKIDQKEYIERVKARFKGDKTVCRSCNGAGKIFDDDTYMACTGCDGVGKKKEKVKGT